jgi:hypothetical protein
MIDHICYTVERMTSKNTAIKMPSPAILAKIQKAEGDKNVALTMFAGPVLDMSWQLAIVGAGADNTAATSWTRDLNALRRR